MKTLEVGMMVKCYGNPEFSELEWIIDDVRDDWYIVSRIDQWGYYEMLPVGDNDISAVLIDDKWEDYK